MLIPIIDNINRDGCLVTWQDQTRLYTLQFSKETYHKDNEIGEYKWKLPQKEDTLSSKQQNNNCAKWKRCSLSVTKMKDAVQDNSSFVFTIDVTNANNEAILEARKQFQLRNNYYYVMFLEYNECDCARVQECDIGRFVHVKRV